jgi:hypothetical protein
MFPRIGQPVFLEAAVGFVGDGVFNEGKKGQANNASCKIGRCFGEGSFLSKYIRRPDHAPYAENSS